LASGDKPVISYFDDSNGALKIAICNDTTCSSPTFKTLDSLPSGIVGSYTSIALASGDKPVVSYRDGTNGNLKLVVCDDSACNSTTITTLDSAGEVGTHTSIALAADDRPVVSYTDNTNEDLKVYLDNGFEIIFD